MIYCRHTIDYAYIRSVIFEPEMLARITDDYSAGDYQDIEGLDRVWLEVVDTDYGINNRVGLGSISDRRDSCVNMHVFIPLQNRGVKSIAYGKAVLKWIETNSPSCIHKINSEIPVVYKDTIAFAKKLGLHAEGYNRMSIVKNGELVDQLRLGISIKRGLA